MKRIIYLILILLFPLGAFSQDNTHDFYVDGENMILRIDLNQSAKSIDSLLRVAGISKVSARDLKRKDFKALMEEHWVINQLNQHLFEMRRSLNYLTEIKENDLLKILNHILRNDQIPGYETNVEYGVNKFKKEVVTENAEGFTRFFLPGFSNAKQVYLAGSFNDWDMFNMPMIKLKDGWEVNLKLNAGKHLYKFIVDGNWIEDPNNLQKQSDGHYGSNSIYFKYNHTFNLDGHKDNKKVILSGSFNNWDEHELEMQKTSAGWELAMYLKPGRHEYKFIVDGEWIEDPTNPETVVNENNTLNSILFIGTTVKFSLVAPNAKSVYLAGSFNGWNPNSLPFKKSNGVWQVSCKIPEGNSQYKFIIDGNWVLDESNPYLAMEGGIVNSLLVVHPNCEFFLKGHLDAKFVALSGDFNNWDEFGYKMEKQENGWYIKINLNPGKHLYKFMVDGKWITDPANDLYEPNGEGNFNSIIWFKPQ